MKNLLKATSVLVLMATLSGCIIAPGHHHGGGGYRHGYNDGYRSGEHMPPPPPRRW